MTILHGIKNCDTVAKACKWLTAHNIDFAFHDFRTEGLDESTLSGWIDQLGWETVINKRSTTWKGLSPEIRENMDAKLAIETALASPTLIKRPVLVTDNHLHVGFKPDQYQTIFA